MQKSSRFILIQQTKHLPSSIPSVSSLEISPFAFLVQRLILQEQLVERNRKIANAYTGRVIDGVGDGGGSADDADFADALGPHRADVRVVLVKADHVDGAYIGVGRDMVRRKVVSHVVAEARVQ